MKKLNPFNQNLFKNTSDKVSFPVSKTEKVDADYFSLESEAKRSIVGRNVLNKDGVTYIQLVVTDQSQTPNVYFRGALFTNNRKTNDKQPDFTGTIDLHDVGEEPVRMRLSAWSREKAGGKAGVYLSISCQAPLSAEERAALAAKTPATADGTAGLPPAGFEDMDDTIPF